MGPLSTATELLLGAVAGALAQIFTIPVSVIATRQQVGRISQWDEQSMTSADPTAGCNKPQNESFLSVAHEIIEEDGVTGLWSGLKPSLVLTVNPAITYGVFERVKSIVLLAKGSFGANVKMAPWLAFLVGAFSKTLATIVNMLSMLSRFH